MMYEPKALKWALARGSKDFGRVQKLLASKFEAGSDKKQWSEIDNQDLKNACLKGSFEHSRVMKILNRISL